MKIDKFTQDAAIEYANNEAELKGFPKGGAEWKKCFKNYVGFAEGTMSVGRNPRMRNPRDLAAWPEIFGDDGFAGIVHRNFKDKDGKHPSLSEVRDRIKASITNLVYMMANAVYGIKTTTKGHKPGRIQADEMSDLQFKPSGGELSSDEAHAENIDVVYNQLAMTVIETAAYEILIPFFTMTKKDIERILEGVKLEGKVNAPDVAKFRTQLEKALRSASDETFKKINFADIIRGSH